MTNVIWLILLLATSQACMAEINLSSDTELAAEGYFVLSWESDSDSPLILEQSFADSFDSVKATEVSSEGSITITGLVDGEYYYRLRGDDREQSNIILVQVAHHSLARALSFFSLGLVLFIILLTTIFIGSRRSEEV